MKFNSKQQQAMENHSKRIGRWANVPGSNEVEITYTVFHKGQERESITVKGAEAGAFGEMITRMEGRLFEGQRVACMGIRIDSLSGIESQKQLK